MSTEAGITEEVGMDAEAAGPDAEAATDDGAEETVIVLDGHSGAGPADAAGPVWKRPSANKNGATAQRAAHALGQLDRWVTDWDISSDPYVDGLRVALQQQRGLSMWATLSPFELLPRPTVSEGRAVRRVARVLAVVRNVMVFVPVAITWLSIQKATDAFGHFAADAPPGAQLSFLQFWQSGGPDYLATPWLIHNVAMVDFLIIAFIVLSTLLVGAFDSLSEAQAARAERHAEADRVALGLAIAEALEGNREATPDSIAESVAKAINGLADASRELTLAAERVEVASSSVGGLTPTLDALHTTADRLATNGTDRVARSLGDLVTVVESLRSSLTSDASRVLSEVLVGLETVNEELARTSTSVEFGTRQLRDDLEAIHAKLASPPTGNKK